MVETLYPISNAPQNAEPSSVNEESRRFAFVARGGSKEFLSCQQPEVILYGPSGTGKSYTSLNKLYMVAQKYPGSRTAIVRKFRSTITQSAMVTFEQKVCVPGDGVKFNTTDQQYNFPNGSAVVVAGLDDPTKILSTEFDIIYVQECTEIEEATWEMLKTRLRWGRVPYQQLIGDCNPDSERHWIKLREKAQKVKLINSRHTDNPAYWDEGKQEWTKLGQDYINNLRQMSGHMYERYYLGNWVGAEGMIYTEYSYKRHLIDPIKLPKEWTRYISIDFGYTNPFVCFDDQTEILTDEGWKPFAALTRQERVATVHPESRAVQWQRPTDYIVQEYHGPMVVSESKRSGANFSVTPNHQMVLENRKDGTWIKARADSMPTGNYAIPVGWEPVAEGDTDTALARFLGLWLADGCITFGGYGKRQASIRIAQKNHPERVREIITALGIAWTERVADNGVIDFRINDPTLVSKVMKLCGKVFSANKRIPTEAFSYGKQNLEALLEGLLLGDGSPARYDALGTIIQSKRFLSTSKGLADDVQAVAALLGLPTTRSVQHTASGYSGKEIDLHTVRFPVARRAALTRMDIQARDYDGTVYCVTVPNGTLIVRRGGRPMVCGNCQWWAEDNDGRIYLYRELYGTQTTVEDWAHQIYDLSKGEKYQAIICDHDAEDRATLERHMGHSAEQCIVGRTKEFYKVPKNRIGTIGADKRRESVHVGIQEVQSRFRGAGDGKPRLYIFRNALAMEPDERLITLKKPTCTEQEIDSYIWDEIKGGRLGDRTNEQPKKVNDHGCLGGETTVMTERGPKFIKHILIGDRVLTRQGYKAVLDSQQTSPAAEVRRVVLSDGAEILATPDHPFWVEGRGWVPCDTLRYLDKLVTYSSVERLCHQSSMSSIEGLPTDAIPMPSSSRIGAIFVHLRRQIEHSFTEICGRTLTGRFRTVTTSTTSTRIPTITPSTTSSASHRRSTSSGTPGIGKAEGEPSPSTFTSSPFVLKRPIGIALRKAVDGIGSTVSGLMSSFRYSTLHVNTVLVSLSRSVDGPNTAPTTAKAPLDGTLASMLSSSCASPARNPLLTPNTTHGNTAGVHVLSVLSGQLAVPTYNLTIEDAPEFFANGVLVHNCDALRYLVHHLDGKNARTSASVFGKSARHSYGSSAKTSGPTDKRDFFKNIR